MIIQFSGHKWHRCEKESCYVCDGALGCCTVCHGAEGSLPTECPGAPMPAHTQDAVYAEQIDYRGGRWRLGRRHYRGRRMALGAHQ